MSQVVTKILIAIVVSLMLVIACADRAEARDPLEGLWQTEPDRKKLTSHIEIRSCAAKFCGTVKAAFDRQGREVRTRNIGRDLFWNLETLGGGRYGNGTVHVPLLNVMALASMTLAGDRLAVRACKAGVCQGQIWTRIR
ncbi:DUF2147 domain-containing protein [Sulfitobacter sabulilitoris]|nr:DUF2147 domain-containing protein [Sulfitobacter sabulilitoris]